MDSSVKTEALIARLQIAWDDHHRSREQSWKGLQLVVILFGAFVGLNLGDQHPSTIRIAGSAVIAIAVLGMCITWHHRNSAQYREFQYICRIQKALGLSQPDLIWNLDNSGPLSGISKITLVQVLNPFEAKINTPLFIIRIYQVVALLSFVIICWT